MGLQAGHIGLQPGHIGRGRRGVRGARVVGGGYVGSAGRGGGAQAGLVKDAPQPLRGAAAEAADTAREEGVVDGERRHLDGRSMEAAPV